MWPLTAAFIEIALRRRGPESLPDSNFLVSVLLAAYVSVGAVYLGVQGVLSPAELGLLAVDVTLVVAFVFAVLRFFKLERRYRQTLCALLGTDIVITLAYFPVALLGLALGLDVNESPFVWVLIAFFFWSIFIGGFVLGRALSQPLIVGLMFEILLVLVGWSIRDILTPATG